MKIRRTRYTPEDGRCCADCDLFTEHEQSGNTTYFESGGKYDQNIFGLCEITEKLIFDADRFYCKRWQDGNVVRDYEKRQNPNI